MTLQRFMDWILAIAILTMFLVLFSWLDQPPPMG